MAVRIIRAPAVGSTSPQRISAYEGVESEVTGTLVNSGRGTGSHLLAASTSVALLGSDDLDDLFPLFKVRSHWTIHALKFAWTAMTAGDLDVGLFPDGSVTEADKDLWTPTAIDVAAQGEAVAPFTSYGASHDMSQMLWEALNLPSDPQVAYDLCVSIQTDITGSGTFACNIFYSE